MDLEKISSKSWWFNHITSIEDVDDRIIFKLKEYGVFDLFMKNHNKKLFIYWDQSFIDYYSKRTDYREPNDKDYVEFCNYITWEIDYIDKMEGCIERLIGIKDETENHSHKEFIEKKLKTFKDIINNNYDDKIKSEIENNNKKIEDFPNIVKLRN